MIFKFSHFISIYFYFCFKIWWNSYDVTIVLLFDINSGINDFLRIRSLAKEFLIIKITKLWSMTSLWQRKWTTTRKIFSHFIRQSVHCESFRDLSFSSLLEFCLLETSTWPNMPSASSLHSTKTEIDRLSRGRARSLERSQ